MENNTATQTDLTVANTIRDQIGGMALRMLGAHSLAGDANSLTFQIKGCPKVSHIRIQLDASDTYTITFGKLNRKTFNFVETASVSFVYADQINKMITANTGLYTRF